MSELADLKAQADQLKDEGNAFLKLNKLDSAVEKYTEAIKILPTAVYYSNRAQAYIKQESYGLAIADATSAIGLDNTYIKAYYRRGSANFALGKSKIALRDFKAVCKMVPADKDAQKKMMACDKVVRAENFVNALGIETITKIPDVDHTTIALPTNYNGPTIGDDGKVTAEFCAELMEWHKDQKKLPKRYVVQILQASIKDVKDLPSLLDIPLPDVQGPDLSGGVPSESTPEEVAEGDLNRRHITVCGDTHGQFYDLCTIFRLGGYPSASNPFLFNGDYVDRGSFSVETVLTLMAWRLADPTSLYMMRGNHETVNMNRIYGFEGEVLHKYDKTVMQLFTGFFSNLPLCSVIERSVFVTHGGLSTLKDGNITLNEIRNIIRNREPPESGLMSDLMWSDPQPEMGRSASKRGIGYSFGPDMTENFLETNKLSLVVRSHEVKDEGYVVEHGGKCITIFSAPNYCDQMRNKGAFIRFYDDMKPVFTTFSEVPHPPVPVMAYASGLSQFGL